MLEGVSYPLQEKVNNNSW